MKIRKPFYLLLFVPLLVGCYRPSVAATEIGSVFNSPAIPTETSAPTETPLPTATETPLPTATAPPAFPDPAGYTWNLVADGFTRPLFITHAGDASGRLFVVGQNGEIWVIENGVTLAEPFLDIQDQVGASGNEQGLLGLAFHPDFETNGLFYIDYTDLNGDTAVARFSVSANPNVADASSEAQLLLVSQPYPNHNGGHLEFGSDGFLYIGLGDGGSGGDPRGNGQSLVTLLGKILRIDVNSGSPYAIPADNPFANGGGLGEIWAYGLRNPWRFSFDAATGDLYIGDVGQGQWEEIDFWPADGGGGANFGWNIFEGTHPYEGAPPAGANLIPPVAEYAHGSGCSVTGGYVYRGALMPEWQGIYFYGDFCSGEVFGLLRHPDGSWESRLLFSTSFLITSFGLDQSGDLYLVDRSGGVYQLQPQ